MLYVVARHAPGGLIYLRPDGAWTRHRADAEPFATIDAAHDVAEAFAQGHVRNQNRQPLTCMPPGRPRLAYG